MDDLQYWGNRTSVFQPGGETGFKPCYKWMTFNTICPVMDNYKRKVQF